MSRHATGRWPWQVPVAGLLAATALLFWLAARHSSFLDIDSGPYLSMAYRVAAGEGGDEQLQLRRQLPPAAGAAQLHPARGGGAARPAGTAGGR